MVFRYQTRGVCSRVITFDLEDGIVRNVAFQGGCEGNSQGLSRLAEGMPAEELVKRLRGVRCGARPTSCPDQLARALENALQSLSSSESSSQSTVS